MVCGMNQQLYSYYLFHFYILTTIVQDRDVSN